MARIVVADDDDDIRAVTVRILLRAGHTVVQACDGAEGLQAVREHRPDLVVSDIDMPRMSGVELGQAIRADPATAGLAVLFVSGSLTPGDPRPAQGRATAMLNKPFGKAELLACVDTLLRVGHQDGQDPSICP